MRGFLGWRESAQSGQQRGVSAIDVALDTVDLDDGSSFDRANQTLVLVGVAPRINDEARGVLLVFRPERIVHTCVESTLCRFGAVKQNELAMLGIRLFSDVNQLVEIAGQPPERGGPLRTISRGTTEAYGSSRPTYVTPRSSDGVRRGSSGWRRSPSLSCRGTAGRTDRAVSPARCGRRTAPSTGRLRSALPGCRTWSC
jgi:hypothetical protein